MKGKNILENTITRFREKQIILPTFRQMRHPEEIPQKIRTKLSNIGLWDLHSLNLFRITWKNEPVPFGGGFGKVNYLEIPSALSGVKARIVLMTGKWFPTGAHKVGAAYGCLVPRLVNGEFDPTYHKAVWPSTGNYCRGGAFDSYLMGCDAVAILPEEMSKERFEWLKEVGAEIFATPGCESNVKEIYDKCWDLRRNRPDCVILNQFDEFGNPTWHFHVTGSALEEVFNEIKDPESRFSAFVSNTGSAGTIGAGDYLRKIYPNIKVVASEALQCPTLLNNGFGGHRIEGIGDKHVPWVHNVRNTDVVTAIDDEDCMRIMRLFNDPEGRQFLQSEGLSEGLISQLSLLGISGIANLIGAIKTARYFDFSEKDTVLTIATDSMELYHSRMEELHQERGAYCQMQAARDLDRCLLGQKTDYMKELSYQDKKAIHHLKYFTWVEQQGKTVEELNAQWYDDGYWSAHFEKAHEWDKMIEAFNQQTGVINEYI
ncbi:MAG TPA: pyridoxal-5-phosphate-dependent protein subunit beta [Saprospirales bacterium]|nr:pyridoxal-5-phosphate-dependent protein subunit beta [Saprospirales bacterium]